MRPKTWLKTVFIDYNVMYEKFAFNKLFLMKRFFFSLPQACHRRDRMEPKVKCVGSFKKNMVFTFISRVVQISLYVYCIIPA